MQKEEVKINKEWFEGIKLSIMTIIKRVGKMTFEMKDFFTLTLDAKDIITIIGWFILAYFQFRLLRKQNEQSHHLHKLNKLFETRITRIDEIRKWIASGAKIYQKIILFQYTYAGTEVESASLRITSWNR